VHFGFGTEKLAGMASTVAARLEVALAKVAQLILPALQPGAAAPSRIRAADGVTVG